MSSWCVGQIRMRICGRSALKGSSTPHIHLARLGFSEYFSAPRTSMSIEKVSPTSSSCPSLECISQCGRQYAQLRQSTCSSLTLPAPIIELPQSVASAGIGSAHSQEDPQHHPYNERLSHRIREDAVSNQFYHRQMILTITPNRRVGMGWSGLVPKNGSTPEKPGR